MSTNDEELTPTFLYYLRWHWIVDIFSGISFVVCVGLLIFLCLRLPKQNRPSCSKDCVVSFLKCKINYLKTRKNNETHMSSNKINSNLVVFTFHAISCYLLKSIASLFPSMFGLFNDLSNHYDVYVLCYQFGAGLYMLGKFSTWMILLFRLKHCFQSTMWSVTDSFIFKLKCLIILQILILFLTIIIWRYVNNETITTIIFMIGISFYGIFDIMYSVVMCHLFLSKLSKSIQFVYCSTSSASAMNTMNRMSMTSRMSIASRVAVGSRASVSPPLTTASVLTTQLHSLNLNTHHTDNNTSGVVGGVSAVENNNCPTTDLEKCCNTDDERDDGTTTTNRPNNVTDETTTVNSGKGDDDDNNCQKKKKLGMIDNDDESEEDQEIMVSLSQMQLEQTTVSQTVTVLHSTQVTASTKPNIKQKQKKRLKQDSYNRNHEQMLQLPEKLAFQRAASESVDNYNYNFDNGRYQNDHDGDPNTSKDEIEQNVENAKNNERNVNINNSKTNANNVNVNKNYNCNFGDWQMTGSRGDSRWSRDRHGSINKISKVRRERRESRESRESRQSRRSSRESAGSMRGVDLETAQKTQTTSQITSQTTSPTRAEGQQGKHCRTLSVVAPNINMSNMSESNRRALVEMIAKFTILTWTIVVSSISVVSMVLAPDYAIYYWPSIVSSIDATINPLCIVMYFSFANQIYRFACTPCHKMCFIFQGIRTRTVGVHH